MNQLTAPRINCLIACQEGLNTLSPSLTISSSAKTHTKNKKHLEQGLQPKQVSTMGWLILSRTLNKKLTVSPSRNVVAKPLNNVKLTSNPKMKDTKDNQLYGQ